MEPRKPITMHEQRRPVAKLFKRMGLDRAVVEVQRRISPGRLTLGVRDGSPARPRRASRRTAAAFACCFRAASFCLLLLPTAEAPEQSGDPSSFGVRWQERPRNDVENKKNSVSRRARLRSKGTECTDTAQARPPSCSRTYYTSLAEAAVFPPVPLCSDRLRAQEPCRRLVFCSHCRRVFPRESLCTRVLLAAVHEVRAERKENGSLGGVLIKRAEVEMTYEVNR
ncbi:hypothetical protein MRX96_001318 [Rhipicephalus microplus]